MATKKEQALVPVEDRYPALSNEVAMILRESLAPGETLEVSNLPTVKIPAGGALAGLLLVYRIKRDGTQEAELFDYNRGETIIRAWKPRGFDQETIARAILARLEEGR